MKNIYIKNGLIYFSELKNDLIQIVTTYDNSVWGNMNHKFADSEKELDQITAKYIKLQKILNTKVAISFTTPFEDTIIDLDHNSFEYLNFTETENEFGIKNLTVRANSGIIYPSNGHNSYIFTPRDCPIFFIIPPERQFILAIHLGAPQVVQSLHKKTFRLASELIKESDFKNSKVFITPHISGDNYYVSPEKYQIYEKLLGSNIKKYVKAKFNEIYQAERNYFDFVGFVKEEINNQFGITDFIETGICTYESTQTGYLYSYKYFQEVEKRIERGEQVNSIKYLGSHNVVIKF